MSSKPDEDSYRPIRGALSRLESRLEDMSKRAEPDPDRTGLRDIEAKLAEIAEHIERKGAERTPVDQTDRLARIESKIAALSTQLDAPAQRSEPQPAAAPPAFAPAPTLAQVFAPAVAPASAPTRRPVIDAVAQIVQRQRELDGDSAYPAPRRAEPRPPFDARRAPNDFETRLDSRIEMRLAAIVERLEKRLPAEDADAPRAEAAVHTAALSGLQGEIARMSGNIERMREDFAQRQAAPPSVAPESFDLLRREMSAVSRGVGELAQLHAAPPQPVIAPESLDLLRREMSAVSRGIGELAPRASISALQRTVHEISDRLGALRFDGMRDAVLAPIEQLTQDLRASLREADLRPAISGLEQDMRGIAAKLESLEARGGVDPQTVRAIFDQTREVRDLLARAATAALPGERAQRELADLAERLDRSDAVGVAPVDVARVVSDIRAVIAEGMGGDGLRALEQRVEQLSSRIDAALSAGADNSQIAAFGERLDKLHRAVAQNLAAPRAAPAAETLHLEQLVRDLAVKVDRASDPSAGRDDLAALQSQIEDLSRKIERSNGQDDMVASLERMIADLFGQLNETRAAALEAAELAARNAARESVREALANAPAPAAQSELGREIAELRSNQNVSDQRTHATLKAVHETLERVVDRLATIEDDIVEERAPLARPAPAAVAVEPPALVANGASNSVAAAFARARESAVEPPREVSRPAPKPASPQAAVSQVAAPQVAAPQAGFRPGEQAGPSFDQDVLIEPGSGRGRRPAAPTAAAADSADKSTQAGFIAAARRAALAAQAASAASDHEAEEQLSEQGASAGRLGQVKALYERRRKPILLSLAALIGLLGALQIARVYIENPGAGVAPPPAIVQPVAPAQTRGETGRAEPSAALEAPKPAEAPAAEAPGAGIDSLKLGSDMTLKLLQKAADSHGLTAIDPTGQPFNPDQHQAIGMQPSPEVPADHVLMVMQKGYRLHERLVRPALVLVSQG